MFQYLLEIYIQILKKVLYNIQTASYKAENKQQRADKTNISHRAVEGRTGGAWMWNPRAFACVGKGRVGPRYRKRIMDTVVMGKICET